MDPLTTAAASGLRARMESLDILANNLANASSSGFKMGREFYGIYETEEAQEGITLPSIDREWTDLSQGAIYTTGKPLDLALEGKGFFSVSTPGGPLYTRNGTFHISSTGTVVTQEGYALRLTDGNPLTLTSTEGLSIHSDGTVIVGDQALGKLAIVDVPEPGGLIKQGATYFRTADPRKTPGPGAADVRQGALENSNVNTAELAVHMVGVMRQFEMLQKAISIGGEMNRKSSEEVARL